MIVVRLAALAAAGVIGAATLQPILTAQPATRLIAIGDIHGSYDGITTILRRAGLVDDALKWTGGGAVLVQTGDYTDRGTDVRKVMDLLMRLEQEAKLAGGQAIVLAGNHEIMNAIGDLRDVTTEICATFATPTSEKVREEAWKQYERVAKPRARLTMPPHPVFSMTRDAFMQAHPPGCLEYREALGPNGLYGKWIRAKDIAAVVDGTLFMHAGINPSRPAPKSIADVNDQVRAEIRRLDVFRKRLADRRVSLPFFSFEEMLGAAVVELTLAREALLEKAEGKDPDFDVALLREGQEILGVSKWSLMDPEGPLWFRGYARWTEGETTAQVTAFMEQMKLTRIVVGHTPTPDGRIAPRYGGRIAIIDTGMLASVYMGNASALEIVGDRMKAIYPDGEVELTPAKAAWMSVPGRTPSRTQATRPAALATAKLMP
jgi:Calcineurin-like phosphoesterase